MITELDGAIAVAKLEAFRPVELILCARCGTGLSWVERVRNKFGWTYSTVKLSFCAGGLEPTRKLGMMESVMSGQNEIVVPCAGITEQHLHVSCKFCGYGWLMQVRGSRR